MPLSLSNVTLVSSFRYKSTFLQTMSNFIARFISRPLVYNLFSSFAKNVSLRRQSLFQAISLIFAVLLFEKNK